MKNWQIEKYDNSIEAEVAVETDIVRVEDASVSIERVSIANEVAIRLVVNGVETTTFFATPSFIKELCIGFLFTSGRIEKISDIVDYKLDKQQWKAEVITSSLLDFKIDPGRVCSTDRKTIKRDRVSSNLRISASRVIEMMSSLQNCKVGGVHIAALGIDGQIPKHHFCDIGRHNAVDKAIGSGLLNNVDFSNSVIVSSGRTSSEMLFKTINAGIPISIARKAPTNQTLLCASEMGITVVGFVRENSFSIYTNSERIDSSYIMRNNKTC